MDLHVPDITLYSFFYYFYWSIVDLQCCISFSRQQYWSGLPLPSPGDLPHPGIEPRSPALQADSLLSGLPGKPTRVERF